MWRIFLASDSIIGKVISICLCFEEAVVPSVTVRNLPDEVHRAIRARAASHGRSTEAEIRDILEQAVKPTDRLRIGDALAQIGREAGLTDADGDWLAQSRAPAAPMSFD